MTQTAKKIHQGRNVKRFRKMLSIKQDASAFELGDDWNQCVCQHYRLCQFSKS